MRRGQNEGQRGTQRPSTRSSPPPPRSETRWGGHGRPTRFGAPLYDDPPGDVRHSPLSFRSMVSSGVREHGFAIRADQGWSSPPPKRRAGTSSESAAATTSSGTRASPMRSQCPFMETGRSSGGPSRASCALPVSVGTSSHSSCGSHRAPARQAPVDPQRAGGGKGMRRVSDLLSCRPAPQVYAACLSSRLSSRPPSRPSSRPRSSRPLRNRALISANSSSGTRWE